MDGAHAAFETLVTTAPSALAYVHFMRFVRRVDGAPAARKAFARCRKDTAVAADAAHITYIAAAHIEYFLNKESRIARNVFELGAFRVGTPRVYRTCWGARPRARCVPLTLLFFCLCPAYFGRPLPLAKCFPRTRHWVPLECGLGGRARLCPFFGEWITVTSCCVSHPSRPLLWLGTRPLALLQLMQGPSSGSRLY